MRKKNKFKGSAYLIFIMVIWGLWAHAVCFAFEEWHGNIATNVNLRQSPGLDGKIITGLERGDKVLVKHHEGQWYQVVHKGGAFELKGWVFEKYISKDETAKSKPELQERDLLFSKQKHDSSTESVREKALGKKTLIKEETIAAAEPHAGKTAPLTLPFPVDDKAVVKEKALSTDEEGQQVVAFSHDTTKEKDQDKRVNPDAIITIPSEPEEEPEAYPFKENENEKPTLVAADVSRTEVVGITNYIALILRLSTVILACMALVFSYQALHIARTSRDMAGNLEYIKQDIDKYIDRLKEKRSAPRKTSLTVVDFVVEGRAYNGYIYNISAGGAFIETREPLSVGLEIIMTFPSPANQGYEKKKGEIVRTNVKGIGVRFLDRAHS